MMDALIGCIKEARTIALISHYNPDMDALGSTVGFKLLLDQTGKRVDVFNQDEVPEHYRFIEGMELVKKPDQAQVSYDLAISMDVSDPVRMGDAARVFESAAQHAFIDHHRTTAQFADVHILEPEAAATSQLVVRIAQAMHLTIGKQAANALFAGLSTDTGNFSYESVTPEVFTCASVLVAAGAKPGVITQCLYRTSSAARIRLMGRVLDRMELLEEGKLAILTIRARDMQDLGAQIVDTEGIINFGLEIDSVCIAVLLTERGDKIKCSMRSAAPYDVAAICARLGGGGHIRAAGADFAEESLESARATILHALREVL